MMDELTITARALHYATVDDVRSGKQRIEQLREELEKIQHTALYDAINTLLERS